MGTWAVAGCATVIFMSLYSSQDFATRLNFKIAPHIEFQIIAVIGIVVNFIFCYVYYVVSFVMINHHHQIHVLDIDLKNKTLVIGIKKTM